SKPVIPKAWQPLRKYLLDTDEIFELKTLPKSMAIVGLGVIGLELGQALGRLGVKIAGISLDKAYGGLSDSVVQDEAHAILTSEFPVQLAAVDDVHEEDGFLILQVGDTEIKVERALVTMGRNPQFEALDLGKAGASFDAKGNPV